MCLQVEVESTLWGEIRQLGNWTYGGGIWTKEKKGQNFVQVAFFHNSPNRQHASRSRTQYLAICVQRNYFGAGINSNLGVHQYIFSTQEVAKCVVEIRRPTVTSHKNQINSIKCENVEENCNTLWREIAQSHEFENNCCLFWSRHTRYLWQDIKACPIVFVLIVLMTS